ncbi:MAG: leucine-rich repeat domain-containing protein [Alphaproteobacteria bacterium]|nr:leucine-rich repeat domain-containing protein [Alphaproteobacteria bacterium]
MKTFLFYFSILFFVFLAPIFAADLTESEKELRINEFIKNLQCDNPNQNFETLNHTILSGELKIFNIQISPETMEKLCDLTWVTNLQLSSNGITNLPNSFGNLTNLNNLSICNNLISNLPESFCNLQNLNSLNFSHNKLTKLPESFGKLQNLKLLSFENNELEDLPESFCDLGNLTELILKQNQLKNLPDLFGKLINLTSASFQNNKLTNLPKSFDQLEKLIFLDLSINQLKDALESLGNLINLNYLDLCDNKLNDLHDSFGNLKKLTFLSLNDNELIHLPASLSDLRNTIGFINLYNNPLQHRGIGNTLGEEELQRIFGDRIVLPMEYHMVPITQKDLYQKLDAAEISINRETIKDYRMQDVPDLGWDADQFMKNWKNLLDLLILEDVEEERIKTIHPENRSDEEKKYTSKSISYEMLSNDFQNSYPGLTNKQKIELYILPRLNGFLKTMWGLPLDETEKSEWQMYEESIPELQRNLSYIISRMADQNLDSDARHVLMFQLTYALFQCPTGQKEGVEAILLSLLTELKGDGLSDKIYSLLAREKNLLFKCAIMPGKSLQNVHILSVYFEKLKDELGLTGYFENFSEKIGIGQGDPFQGSLGNALEAFYAKFNPDYLIKFLMNHIEDDEDFKKRQIYTDLLYEKRNENSENSKENEIIRKNLNEYAQNSKKERPIFIEDFMVYLIVRGILKTKNEKESSGWEDYFEFDPMGEIYPKIKMNGLLEILIQMNVLKKMEKEMAQPPSSDVMIFAN